MALKLFISHFIISLFAIAVLGLTVNDFFCFVLVMLSGCLYFLSGYIFTKTYICWFNYFSVAAVGVSFWILCYLISPESTNYKREASAGFWFYYELYILVKSPLNFVEMLNDPYSLTRDLITKLCVPILISILQSIGGQVKLRKLKIVKPFFLHL